MSNDRTLPFPQPDPMLLPPRYAELRADDPVARVRTTDGQSAWLITSYDAVSTVLSDGQSFGVTPPGTPTDQNDSLLQDGPGHARLRRLVGKAFTARAVTELRPGIERRATDLVLAMAADGTPGDLVDALGAPLAIGTIAELLGVEITEQDRFRSMADAVSVADPFGHEADPAAGLAAWREFGGYITELVRRKRQHLGNDLLSRLIEVRDTEDGQLSDGELVTLASTIVAAGYITASSAISIGTLLLFDMDGFRRLHDHPDQLPHVVEEVLRMLSGLNGDTFPRFAHRDVTLAGVSIAAGDLVQVRLGPANRDPAAFDEPECLRPGRFATDASRHEPAADGRGPETSRHEPAADGRGPATTHLAFGRGPHYCLGASLARVEVAAALGALARELPGLRLVGSAADVAWIRTHSDSGPTALPVSW